MDPLSQAALGAATAALFSRRASVRRAIIVGAFAGAAPDVDVFIRSDVDPLLSLEYHRHFTHALLFAPIIGLLIAGLCKLVFFWKRWNYRELALFGIVGALTHGLLDACTSYGTLLYLPFSNHRESWDIISIVDPIFTLPLALMTVFAFAWRQPLFARMVFTFCMLYFCFGIVQRERAQSFAEYLMSTRGHEQVTQMTARTSFGNTIVWRILYRVEDTYYADAVQLMPFQAPRHYPGASVGAYTIEDRRVAISDDSTLGDDIERFRFFSQNYLYQSPDDSSVVGDLRYAMFPDSIKPLWGIRVDETRSDEHTELLYFRDASSRSFDRLWQMILGKPVGDSSWQL
ncbi:MAG: metal-dependent hydrolase [Opitutaceae bacterium]